MAVEKTAVVDGPIVNDFYAGVRNEVAFQLERWGTTHDAAKADEDWFWLIGFLAGKALSSLKTGDRFKALHHTISTAAVLAQWHTAIVGADPSLKVEHDPSRAAANALDDPHRSLGDVDAVRAYQAAQTSGEEPAPSAVAPSPAAGPMPIPPRNIVCGCGGFIDDSEPACVCEVRQLAAHVAQAVHEAEARAYERAAKELEREADYAAVRCDESGYRTLTKAAKWTRALSTTSKVTP